jgi:hypothetical protein
MLLMKHYDKDYDGRLNYADFCSMFAVDYLLSPTLKLLLKPDPQTPQSRSKPAS